MRRADWAAVGDDTLIAIAGNCAALELNELSQACHEWRRIMSEQGQSVWHSLALRIFPRLGALASLNVLGDTTWRERADNS